MKFTRYALAATLAATTWGTGAFGQNPTYNGQGYQGPQTNATRPVSYDYYASQDGSSDVQYSLASSSSGGEGCAAPGCSAPGGGCTAGGGSGCDSCCRDGFCWPCGCALADMGDANKWFDGCFFTSREINAGGWLAQSYTWNPYVPTDRFNGPVTWTDRANEYQMNEFYTYFRKAAKTDDCCWNMGYGLDALYGTNYRWTTSSGFETGYTFNNAFYGLSVPQAYLEFGRNDLTVKVGRFLSPVGYYAVGTNNNFFPVLPYTFQYGEPFTHTGILANKKVNDKLTTGVGVVRGWDNSDNTNPNMSFIGQANVTRDNGDTLNWFGILGSEIAGGVSAMRYMQSLVYTRKFSDDIMGVLQSDYGQQDNALAGGGTARWYGLNSYLYWNMTCRCQWGLNGEWFRDEGGTRVTQVLPTGVRGGSPNARGWVPTPAGSTFNGSFYRVTFGPKYFFTPNLYSRAAFLFDAYSGAGPRPFDDGTKVHQEMGVFDLVYTF